jgi:predicted Zn-dependent protease
VSQSDFVSRGQALVAAGQYQEAVKVCRLGLLGRPTTVEGRVVLGQALLALKRYDEVLAEMRVALELDHSNVPAQILKGEALLRKNDTSAAIETLHKARQAAPGDARILQLLAQCEQQSMKGPSSSPHSAVAFVGSGDTKHYPNHHGEEDSGGGFTRPTSLSAPGALRRSSQRQAAAEPLGTPSPEQLAVGDKSGTVEVDPELDGIEMPDDLDFDDLAAPPKAAKPGKIGGARGSVKSSKPERTVKGQGLSTDKKKKTKTPKPRKTQLGVTPTPTPMLDLDDAIEVQETHLPEPARGRPGEVVGRPSRPGGTALRNAIGMSSGPLDGTGAAAPSRDKPKTLPPPSRDKPMTGPPPPSRDKPMTGPPALAHMIAGQPFAMQMNQPPSPNPGVPRLAAALPTVAAMQPPPAPPPQPMPLGNPQVPRLNAALPTMAIPASLPPPPPQAPAQQVDWGAPAPPPNRNIAAAFEPTARPGELLDPNIAALVQTPVPPAVNPVAMIDLPVVPQAGMRTGMRRPRSRLQIFMWMLVGVIVIGGGVFAGFQIRAMRLQKQIAALRGQATGLATTDTWVGWTKAYASLADIANASSTLENRAALARARALIAYEFADGAPDAKAAVEALGGPAGLDGEIAQTYVALANNEPKAAKIAADAAAPTQDAAALYVAGGAALLAGDATSAQKYMKEAVKLDGRPFYGIGLARAYAASYAWDDAIGTLDAVLKNAPDHPGALIERARMLVAAGRITPSVGIELKAQLDKIVAEGNQPLAKQTRGASPGQVGYATLAAARVDFARNEPNATRIDLKNATNNGVDDQRFAEEWLDTLYAVGDYNAARAASDRVLQIWPASRRGRITLAQILLAQGRAQDADDALSSKQADATGLPLGLAVRGQIRVAAGDVDGARADFDAALKKSPTLEPALVGRAWLEVAAGNIDEAKKLIEPRVTAQGAPPAVAVVYAAIMRRSGDAAARDNAKKMLERVVSSGAGPETARAQLELARLYVATGDTQGASQAYAEAVKGDSFEAKLENALFHIDDADLAGGRETLEALYKAQGDHPRADLALELVRAQLLSGMHDDAKKLLEQAEKLPNVVKWKVEREKGRLALRKGDIAGAAAALSRALDASGSDVETFLLAADTATADDKQAAGLVDKVKKLAPERLKGLPEEKIVSGKLAIAASDFTAARDAFRAAKDMLEKPAASQRRRAQAVYGLAAAKYYLKEDADALLDLELAIGLDASLYPAYLFRANLIAPKKPKEALELTKKATQYNPDSSEGWALEASLAKRVGDKKAVAEAAKHGAK